MASRFSVGFLSVLFVVAHLTVALPSPDGAVIFEDGYTVTTVLDGDKSNYKLNPHAILHLSPPSDLFIVLDSAASTFYTVSIPSASTNETVIERLAGNGDSNYVDGYLGSARFNKPRSFAIDHNGNVYVADQRNHAIRKITMSGVSTIAGGSQKAGRTDGAARDATFSDDFELAFIPEVCALMISDHGNRLVRQINLRAGDCRRHSRSALGTTSFWILGLGLSSVVGLILGFVIRPHVLPYEEGHKPPLASWTWTHCLMNLETQAVMLCSGITNAVVESAVYGLFCKIVPLILSLLPLMFPPVMPKSRPTPVKTANVPELVEVSNNSSSSSSNLTVSPALDDPMKDLLTSYGQLVPEIAANEEAVMEEHVRKTRSSSGEPGNIEAMILANLVSFEEETARVACSDSLDCSLGLVKRR